MYDASLGHEEPSVRRLVCAAILKSVLSWICKCIGRNGRQAVLALQTEWLFVNFIDEASGTNSGIDKVEQCLAEVFDLGVHAD